MRLLSFRPGFTFRPFDCLSLGLDVFVSEQELREKRISIGSRPFLCWFNSNGRVRHRSLFRSRLRPRPAGSRPPLFISMLESQFVLVEIVSRASLRPFRSVVCITAGTPCGPVGRLLFGRVRALFVRTRAHQFEFGFLKKKKKLIPQFLREAIAAPSDRCVASTGAFDRSRTRQQQGGLTSRYSSNFFRVERPRVSMAPWPPALVGNSDRGEVGRSVDHLGNNGFRL